MIPARLSLDRSDAMGWRWRWRWGSGDDGDGDESEDKGPGSFRARQIERRKETKGGRKDREGKGREGKGKRRRLGSHLLLVRPTSLHF
jgi:hypothetical protein